ncbi:hypothetical protein DV737_g803, partial [Chaetothyriales sp. CBS 132003]
MALLDSHLEQMAASATAIGELEFTPPKIFTNALLGAHEITALIRDTEPHERSLFSLDPSPAPPAQQSAVARVLGPDMLADIRRSTRGRGVDVAVLLSGAQKLCEAYAVAGVPQRIRAISTRHQRIAASVEEHEEKVLQLQSKLNRLHAGEADAGNDDADDAVAGPTVAARPHDMDALEAEVAELEARKRRLEERVAGMDADLGGLLQVPGLRPDEAWDSVAWGLTGATGGEGCMCLAPGFEARHFWSASHLLYHGCPGCRQLLRGKQAAVIAVVAVIVAVVPASTRSAGIDASTHRRITCSSSAVSVDLPAFYSSLIALRASSPPPPRMLPQPSKPVGPWGSPEPDLRSARSHSDIWSSSGRSVSGGMPTASPRPAYIAHGPAEHLTSSELDRPTSVLEPALDLANGLLDYALFTLLTIARSTTLPALRLAVPKLLKARLGQAAIRAADEDLQDMADAGEEELDPAAEPELPAQPRSFDPELAWKLARLRAMAHVRLGDLEEQDCDDYVEQDGLDEYVSHPVLAAGPASALFLTSIIDFLGEQALCLAAQSAERRHAAAIVRQASATSPAPDDRGPVVVGAADMHALGRDGPLSRLWRAWRRDARVAESSWALCATTPAPLAATPAPLASPTLTESARSRKGSIISPDKPIAEEEDARPAPPPPPIHIPQPARASDRRATSQPRSGPAAATSPARVSPPSPVSPILRPADAQFQGGRSPPDPHPLPSLSRPLSLPPSAKTRNASEPVSPEPASPEPASPELDSPSPLAGVNSDTASPDTVASPDVLGLPLDSHSPLQAQHSQELTATGVQESQAGEEASGSGWEDDGTEEATGRALQANQAEELTTSTDEQDLHRAGIISGAVGAIAGVLGIEAMRSAQQSRQRKDSSSTTETQLHKSVAEEIMGPSRPVAAPANASTGPSINSARDFDDMHIPVVDDDDADPIDQHPRHRRQVSDPEDLALSSTDDERLPASPERLSASPERPLASPERPSASPTPQRPPIAALDGAADQDPDGAADQDPHPVDPNAAQPQASLPVSPTSPTGVNGGAAVIDHHIATLSPDQVVDAATAPKRPVQSLNQPPSAKSPRESASQYSSHSDQMSASVYPRQRPVSDERRDPVAPAASAQQATYTDKSHPATSTDKSHPAISTDKSHPATSTDKSHPVSATSISTSSRYSQQSQASRTSSKLLVLQREQDSPRSPHRAGPSSAAAPEGHVAAGPNDEEKKKSLEILINSDETLHYTLTPESARPQDGTSRSPGRVKTQTQELADFFRTTAPPGEAAPVHVAAAKPNSTPPRPAAQSRTADQLLTPVEQRASQRAASQSSFKPHSPLGVPRDARPERNTTRDLADYVRSTGPTTDAQLPHALGTPPSAGRYPVSGGGARTNGTPVSPQGARSSSSLPSSNTAKSTNRLHHQARDPRPARGVGTAELIDFIQEGPPRPPTGDARADRPRAPFRSTMDSEDFNNVRASMGSARNSSVLTTRSVPASTNSRTGLLDGQKASNRANGASSASPGIAHQTIPELDRMPHKTRTAPRDPYAIDDSDDEALEEELARARPKQESLIDFLRNTAPSPGMSTLPVLAAVPDADSRRGAKSSAGPSRLRDLVGRSSSAAHGQGPRGGRSTKLSNGARESSPHLTQVGSKLDKYRPTYSTHAAHVERNRQKARAEPSTASTLRTGTSDLADYLRTTGPVEPAAGSSDVYGGHPLSVAKDQASFAKFFKWRGSVKR